VLSSIEAGAGVLGERDSGIAGVWKLRSFLIEEIGTGRRIDTFGAEPRGALMMHPDGRMIVVITPHSHARI
jgi:hypothetical protein